MRGWGRSSKQGIKYRFLDLHFTIEINAMNGANKEKVWIDPGLKPN